MFHTVDRNSGKMIEILEMKDEMLEKGFFRYWNGIIKEDENVITIFYYILDLRGGQIHILIVQYQ